ncbi:MAG: alpha/beta hydrolase [Acidobacteria bacterium]|nr:alpha/beta hydrolase [Acidobacteriota bacterium]
MTSRPPLPPGRVVELPGRGRTFVRELPGPPGAPTVLLLHGWTATADLNWFAAYEPLAEHFRVIALDHRGHGRGLRTWRRFRIADCADDAAALLDELGITRVIPVGYSMGGPIALLLWRRHAPKVAGLVLCATALRLTSSSTERARLNLLGLFGLGARALPPPAMRALGTRVLSSMNTRRQLGPWVAEELLLGDGRALLDAAAEIARWDGRLWAGDIGVPTSVVVTTLDELVPPADQRAMADAIPGADIYEVAGRHQVCVTDPPAFVPQLVTACRAVAKRSVSP